ncbi:MAG: sugar nucleotide-binding protein, partial [Candidatus Eremiobacteraeota bacterium]|nr:sugar nucleotide-binding protein [Candidatus Eremiobacteraeota bacterium]
SGPLSTNLLDARFATKLAAFARAVAKRYPHLRWFTPINEPLTTARFSALYGHWYPHRRDDRSFCRALVNELKATRCAMEAIREVIPDARLLVTEDLAKTHGSSDRVVREQVAFENERRWLSFDLLCGQLPQSGLVVDYLKRNGVVINAALLRACRSEPDILGCNYYVTSERYLDHRLERYPAQYRGGNGKGAYADIEAVRACIDAPEGVRALLLEAWKRFQRPLAITEVQLACTREEQVRWAAEIFSGAESAQEAGADLRAVTFWSLFGARGWDQLATGRGTYEPGAFDVRYKPPKRTSLGGYISALAKGATFDHPALHGLGWWRQVSRFTVAPVLKSEGVTVGLDRAVRRLSRPILILGNDTVLGGELQREAHARDLAFSGVPQSEIAIYDEAFLRNLIASLRPWAVLDCSGEGFAWFAQEQRFSAPRGIVQHASAVAAAARAARCALVFVSSSDVFAGNSGRPYRESDVANANHPAAKARAEAEHVIAGIKPDAMVARCGLLFGASRTNDWLSSVLRQLLGGKAVQLPDGLDFSALYAPEAAKVILDLVIDGAAGTWHLANEGSVNGADLLRETLFQLRVNAELHSNVSPGSVRHLIIGSERGAFFEDLDSAIQRFGSVCGQTLQAA